KRVTVPVPLTHRAFIIFAGEFIALSLCWCPHVILYNYLTYLLLTLGTVLVLKCVTVPVPMTHFFAGFCLGLNIMVRFANLTNMALILVVWFDAWRRKQTLPVAVKRTLLCIAGYVAGMGLPMLAIVLRYGAGAYGEMIKALFTMTGTAEDYGAAGMLTAILRTYTTSLAKMLPLLAAVCICTLILHITASMNTERISPDDSVVSETDECTEQSRDLDATESRLQTSIASMNTKRSSLDESVVSDMDERTEQARDLDATESRLQARRSARRLMSGVFCVLIVLFSIFIMYRRGVFTRSYHYYDAIFEPAMWLLILGIVLCVYTLVKYRDEHIARYSLAALVLIFITPLGSNNYTYPLLNNLFLVAPILLLVATRLLHESIAGTDHNVRQTNSSSMNHSTGAVAEPRDLDAAKSRFSFSQPNTPLHESIAGTNHNVRQTNSSSMEHNTGAVAEPRDLDAAESRLQARRSAWRLMSAGGYGTVNIGYCVLMSLSFTLVTVAAVLAVQGAFFHVNYSFRDGTDGTPRDTVITAIPRANGMKTTAKNAATLESLYERLATYREVEAQGEAYGEEAWGMIQFGTAPGLPYLMEIEPALFTSWPDLDSITVAEFEKALQTMKGAPIMIVKKNPATGEADYTGTALGAQKWEILQAYMNEHHYRKEQRMNGEGDYEDEYDIYICITSSRGY
ncbi:MAG: hypothetical protein IJR58_04370, partial [Lachnospiraceae bacterium]|nr:hypothetical protein [Lachnospiraceae bacterium]